MSMSATFVQMDDAELSRMQADPESAEVLFRDAPVIPPAFGKLAKTMQDRLRAGPPTMTAEALSRLDPQIRKQVEASLGRLTAAFGSGAGMDEILKLIEKRARASGSGPPAGERAVLSLDKAWHGVHYVLCGEVEPGATLLSQAVLGGVPLGDDDEGLSGYGPARYFTVAQVAELSRALSRPELEQEAAARFDAARMSQLNIYPGWRESDAEWVMDAFRRLRDFYAGAAAKGCAIVTCLV